MKKNIEVLFGDDQFAEVQTRCIFKSDYANELNKQFNEVQFNWTYQTDHQETIREAQTGKYDVVVSDLNYTNNGEQGYEVIEQVSRLNPKPLLILCTASKSPEISSKAGRADFIATAGGKCFHKFDALIKILGEHYSSLENEGKK